MIVVIALFVVAIDQVSKLILSSYLSLHHSIPLIKPFLFLSLVHNTGIAFGMLKGHARSIVVVTLVGLLCVLIFARKDLIRSYSLSATQKLPRGMKIAIGLIVGGAVGNMADRFRFGYVIDFIDLRVWPVFNCADSCITIGACIVFWYLCITEKRKKA